MDEDKYTVEFNHLPDEIIEFILTYLPPYNDLMSCSLVCKRWNDIVKNLIHRAKLSLNKGINDFRLEWQVFTQKTQYSIEKNNHSSTSSTSIYSHSMPLIAGRFSHSAVRYKNSMYVFGGGSSSDTTFNDLWCFDLSGMRWERPLSMGSYPSPKGSASMVSWHNQLILFGGWRYPSLHPPYQPWCLFDELHFYDLEHQRWTAVCVPFSPPPMAGHSASVHGNFMVVFGGYQIDQGVNSNSNETWCLDLLTHKWWKPRILGDVKPPPRYGQFQVELDEKHMLIVGGCGGPNSVYSDAWLLDMTRDIWSWRTIPVRNKKFGASHMWCNSACKVGSKLLVLGPTPNMPSDFLMMKQTRSPLVPDVIPGVQRLNNGRAGNELFERQNLGVNGGPVGINAAENQNHNRLDNFRVGDFDAVAHDQYVSNRRAIINQHIQNASNSFNNNNNNNLQPRSGCLSDLHAILSSPNLIDNSILNFRPTTSNAAAALQALSTTRYISAPTSTNVMNEFASPPSPGNMNEAANRLQRNLALRCRENEPALPKRFDEMHEDPFRMAAFNVQNRPRSGNSKDHNERIRRMEEKMNAIRNSRRSVPPAAAETIRTREPSPTRRIKRNVLSLFVCDLAAALDPVEPFLQWLEHKNFGVLPGAPERLILSTLVLGHGELILFGGVHKESLSEMPHQVSSAIHFLSAPRDIV